MDRLVRGLLEKAVIYLRQGQEAMGHLTAQAAQENGYQPSEELVAALNAYDYLKAADIMEADAEA